jgi:uncharacterized protein (DUF924 family)
MTTPDEVLRYWFGDGDGDDPELGRSKGPLWFSRSEPTDADIRERFGEALEAAARGELEHWAATPRGRLALVIVLDQFSRNVFRGTPRMFTQDERARSHTHAALAAREDAALSLFERLFLYLPLEHSELLEEQRRCLALFEAMRDAAPPALRETAESFVGYAHRHLDIIARFGRFPHRNATLGRTATPEEIEFLKQPGSSF